jgi:hypothetical protein
MSVLTFKAAGDQRPHTHGARRVSRRRFRVGGYVFDIAIDDWHADRSIAVWRIRVIGMNVGENRTDAYIWLVAC